MAHFFVLLFGVLAVGASAIFAILSSSVLYGQSSWISLLDRVVDIPSAPAPRRLSDTTVGNSSDSPDLPDNTNRTALLVSTRFAPPNYPPGSPFCHLSSLNIPGPVHLWTMVPADGNCAMLGHFISHYASLGVPLQNMFFLIHAKIRQRAEAVYSILERNGIPNARKQSSIEDRMFSSEVKRDRVNGYIKKLAEDTWMVYADLDELFHFSCDISKYVMYNPNGTSNISSSNGSETHKHPVMCGRMADRFAFAESSAPIIPPLEWSLDRPIHEQYSQCATIRRGYANQAANNKILLFPTRIRYRYYEEGPYNGDDGEQGPSIFTAKFRNAHGMSYTRKGQMVKAECRYDGAINHYAWTAETMQLMGKKAAAYSQWKDMKKSRGRARFKNYIQLFRMVEQVKRRELNANGTTAAEIGAAAEWILTDEGKKAVKKFKTKCPETIASKEEFRLQISNYPKR